MVVTSLNLDAFDRALTRARTNGIRLRPTASATVFHATSGRTGKLSYAVAVTGELAGHCSCPAGRQHVPCQHLAAALSAVERRTVSEAARTLARFGARKRARKVEPVALAAD